MGEVLHCLTSHPHPSPIRSGPASPIKGEVFAEAARWATAPYPGQTNQNAATGAVALQNRCHSERSEESLEFCRKEVRDSSTSSE